MRGVGLRNGNSSVSRCDIRAEERYVAAINALWKGDFPSHFRSIGPRSSTRLRFLIGNSGAGILKPLQQSIVVQFRRCKSKVDDTTRLIPPMSAPFLWVVVDESYKLKI